MEVVYWKNVRFSPIKLDPRMLLPDGLVLKRKCYLKGENHYQIASQARYVRYDRQFVVQSVISLMKPLSGLNEEQFNEIMHEVFYTMFSLKQGNDGTIYQGEKDRMG